MSSVVRIRLRWVVVILVALWNVYFAVLHPWFMNWGATAAERRMALPIDDVLPDKSHRFTRAITIRAPTPVVWKWVIQIGEDRAGFYSNTWLENLTGANIHNANAIHTDWQHRSIGDHVLLARADLFPGAQTSIVALEPERWIAYIPCPFVLQPIDQESTRLLIRESIPSTLIGRAFDAIVWDPMHFVMEQRMLRGIKERAERRLLAPAAMMAVARIGWILASASLLGAFLVRARRRPWVLLPLTITSLVLWSTGDWDAVMAGFLAIGITVIGLVTFGRRWWLPYLLLAAAVALMLLLAPDAYTAFGFALGIAAAVLVVSRFRLGNNKTIAEL